VSTEEQNPKHQEKTLKTYASQQNLKVYRVYTDTITGRSDKRPQLNNMLIDMRQGCFDCILCYKIDRLGRSAKHLLTICEELNNKNIQLIFTSQNIDTKTAIGKMFFTILGAIAEFESELISERTKLALKYNRRVGKRGPDKRKRKKRGGRISLI
jgi:DNA invertase Pin-like site-specific DNA recombinase